MIRLKAWKKMEDKYRQIRILTDENERLNNDSTNSSMRPLTGQESRQTITTVGKRAEKRQAHKRA